MLAQLAPALDPILRDRVATWRDPQACPPAELLAVLLDLHLYHPEEPWLPALVTYILETDPSRWPRLAQRVSWLCAGLRRVWHAQGCPASVADLDLSGEGLTPAQCIMTTTVGWALERALAGGRAPLTLQATARALLPGRYLPSLGWRNLDGLPEDVLALLVERSGSVGYAVPDDHQALAQRLYGYRNQPWAPALACVVAALLGERAPREDVERNQPMTIVTIAKDVASVMETVCAAHDLQEWSEGGVTKTLLAYANGDYGGPAESVRAHYVVRYLAAVHAQERLMVGDPGLRERLERYLLPPVEVPIDTPDLMARARAAARARRAKQVDTLMPLYTTLAWVVAVRAAIFQNLHAAATQAHKQYRAQGAPVVFRAPLVDGSATLTFRVVSVAQLHEEAALSKRLPPSLVGQVLTEYLGAHDAQGQPLPNPFFAEVYRGWYDPAVRAALVQAGHVGSDFASYRAGLLRAPGQLGRFCAQHARAALAAGRVPPVLVDADALCAGVAYGALLLALSLASGMRMHELQQIRVHDGYAGLDPDGSIHCKVYPKACKRGRGGLVEHILPPYIQLYWREMRRMHDLCWGGMKRVHIQNGPAMGLERGVYLFQSGGTALRQTALGRLVRYVTFGLDLRSQDGEWVSLTTHLLRYGYAHARAELGHSLEQIQAALGHQSPNTTRLYTGGASAEPSGRLSTPVGRTQWSALLPLTPEAR